MRRRHPHAGCAARRVRREGRAAGWRHTRGRGGSRSGRQRHASPRPSRKSGGRARVDGAPPPAGVKGRGLAARAVDARLMYRSGGLESWCPLTRSSAQVAGPRAQDLSLPRATGARSEDFCTRAFPPRGDLRRASLAEGIDEHRRSKNPRRAPRADGVRSCDAPGSDTAGITYRSIAQRAFASGLSGEAPARGRWWLVRAAAAAAAGVGRVGAHREGLRPISPGAGTHRLRITVMG